MWNSCDLREGSCDKSCVMREEMLHNILAANTIHMTRTRTHTSVEGLTWEGEEVRGWRGRWEGDLQEEAVGEREDTHPITYQLQNSQV